MSIPPSWPSPVGRLRSLAVWAIVLGGQMFHGPAAAADATATSPIDLTALESPLLLEGDAETAFRDPAALYVDGEFHLFFTYNRPEADGKVYWYTAHRKSRDLRHWSALQTITPRDQSRNFSSPGNVIRFGGQWLLCLQTYPIPGFQRTEPVRYGDATARIWIMRSRDLGTWSAAELLRVKGPGVPREQMGRMIDPYLFEDLHEAGKWWCFFKQNGASRAWSRDLEHWTYGGHFPAGENVCVIPDRGQYMLFHSPANGIGVKRSQDLIHWRDEGLLTLGQRGWPWARGRITAGFVLDLRGEPAIGKALMFFHGSRYGETDPRGGFFNHASIGLAWSDDLESWTWPGAGD